MLHIHYLRRFLLRLSNWVRRKEYRIGEELWVLASAVFGRLDSFRNSKFPAGSVRSNSNILDKIVFLLSSSLLKSSKVHDLLGHQEAKKIKKVVEENKVRFLAQFILGLGRFYNYSF